MIIGVVAFSILVIAACIIPVVFRIQVNYSSYISTVISIATLIATIGIAVLIYYKQKKDGQQSKTNSIKRAKAIMASEIESAIESRILPSAEFSCSFVGHDTRSLFLANSEYLHDILSPQQFIHLSSVVQFIDSYDKEDEYEGLNLIFRYWIVPLLCSKYREYFSLVFDYHELLNKKTFDLIATLNDSKEKYQIEKNSIHCTEGNELFIFDPKSKRIVVDDNTTKHLDGIIAFDEKDDEYKIKEGFEKDHNYEGQYFDFMREGKGCSFDEDGNKASEGIWSEDKLIKGTEYNYIYIDNGDEEDNCVGSYENILHMWISMHMEITETGIERYYVVDRVVLGDKIESFDNRRPLRDFLKETNPRLLNLIEM